MSSTFPVYYGQAETFTLRGDSLVHITFPYDTRLLFVKQGRIDALITYSSRCYVDVI